MTQLERIKNMTVDELAEAIYYGISSDPCDYCKFNNGHCTGEHCENKSYKEIIAEYLESEVEEE